ANLPQGGSAKPSPKPSANRKGGGHARGAALPPNPDPNRREQVSQGGEHRFEFGFSRAFAVHYHRRPSNGTTGAREFQGTKLPSKARLRRLRSRSTRDERFFGLLLCSRFADVAVAHGGARVQ